VCRVLFWVFFFHFFHCSSLDFVWQEGSGESDSFETFVVYLCGLSCCKGIRNGSDFAAVRTSRYINGKGILKPYFLVRLGQILQIYSKKRVDVGILGVGAKVEDTLSVTLSILTNM